MKYTKVLFFAAAFAAFPNLENASATENLGPLTRFYRHTQFPGSMVLTNNGKPQRFFLDTIPLYLTGTDIDFRYLTKPNASSEVAFADTLTIVSALGGNRQRNQKWDLLQYSANKGFNYRFELFTNALAPYIAQGYRPQDITLQLSAPWVLTVTPGDLQNNPNEYAHCTSDNVNDQTNGNIDDEPDKYGSGLYAIKNIPQYRDLIRHFVEHLKRFSGSEGFRYEVNGERTVQCNGSISTAENEYRHVHDVLSLTSTQPNLMHGEFAERFSPQVNVIDRNNAHNFYTWARSNNLSNMALAQSMHYVQNVQNDHTYNRLGQVFQHPGFMGTTEAAHKIMNFFQFIRDDAPAIPLEVHQFGLLSDQAFDGSAIDGVDSNAYQDMGPRLASWHFQTMFKTRQISPVKFYHWDVTFDRLFYGANKQKIIIPSGLGWLYQILDNLEGATTTVVPMTAINPSADTEPYAVAFRKGNKLYVIASTFSADNTKWSYKNYRITLPASLGQIPLNAPVRYSGLSYWNAPHYYLKAMIQAGKFPGVVLDPMYQESTTLSVTTSLRRIARLNQMAKMSSSNAPTNPSAVIGAVLANSNNPITKLFQARIKDLYKLKNISWSDAPISEGAAGAKVLDSGLMAADHVRVFEITLP